VPASPHRQQYVLDIPVRGQRMLAVIFLWSIE
jgi:hypothetical protein